MAEIGKNIDKAASILKSGRLVAIPTETVYGLAGNALDPEAVMQIFETKNRPSFDPLITHISNFNLIGQYVAEVPEPAVRLAERFWPGPLTLLLPKKDIIPDMVTSGLPTVAIRVPDNDLTLNLLHRLSFPLVAPSANPFGYISPTSARHVDDQLGNQIDYILDGGPCRVGLESTIIGFPDGVPTVYRLGGLSLDQVSEIVGDISVMPHSSSNPKAPGMLKSHYAPRLPFHLTTSSQLKKHNFQDNSAILVYQKAPTGIQEDRVRILAPDGDLHTAAKNLFRYMRELDQLPVSGIYAEQVPEEGLGRAINDRLRRAASGH